MPSGPENLSQQFDNHRSELKKSLRALEGLTEFSSSGHFFSTVKPIVDRIGEMYKLAISTASESDDLDVDSDFRRARRAVSKTLDASSAHFTPDESRKLKEYFSIRTYILEQLSLQPITEAQKKALEASLDSLALTATEFGDKGMIDDADELRVKEKTNAALPPHDDRDVEERFNLLNNKDFVGYVDKIGFDKLIPEDKKRYTELMSPDKPIGQALGRLTDFSSSPEAPLSAEQVSELKSALRMIRDNYSFYRSKLEGLAELQKIEHLFFQMLHEHRVLGLGARNEQQAIDSRKYLRPSLRPIPNPILAGRMERFLIYFMNEIDTADDIGAIVAEGIKNGTPGHEVIDEAKRARLLAIKKRIGDYVVDQTELTRQASHLSVDEKDQLQNFIAETSKYTSWLNTVIEDTEIPAAAAAAIPHYADGLPPDIEPHGNYEGLEHVIKADLLGAVDRLVTHDFGTGTVDGVKVENVYLTYTKILRKEAERTGSESLIHVAEMLELLTTMFADHTFDKANVNFDNISVRWEEIKGALDSANKLKRYDKFRQNELWQKVVAKLSDRAFIYMLDSATEWAASKPWGTEEHNRKLFTEAHNELYYGFKMEGDVTKRKRVAFTSDADRDKAIRNAGRNRDRIFDPDAEYRRVIDDFPENTDPRFTKEAAIAFCKEVVWYDASLNDLRTKAAMIHLGVLKKSFKHSGGQQPLDAHAGILNGGYQNKNFDNGFWATFFGAMVEVPNQVSTGGCWLSDVIPDTIPKGSIQDKFISAANLPPTDDLTVEDKNDVKLNPTRIQLRIHKENFKRYSQMIDVYFQWRFGKSWDKLFRKWKPSSLYSMPTMDAVLRAPLSSYDGTGTRLQSNTWDNYTKSAEANLWLLERAIQSFSKDIQWTGDPLKDRNMMIDMGKDLGSKLAQSFAYRWSYEHVREDLETVRNRAGNKVIKHGEDGDTEIIAEAANLLSADERNRLEKAVARQNDQMNLLRVITQFYLIYIMDQIPLDDLKNKLIKSTPLRNTDKEVREYYEYVELFIKAVGEEYAKGNTSFNIWDKYLTKAYEHILKHNTDFMHASRWLPAEARTGYWYWHNKIMLNENKRGSFLSKPTEEKSREPVYPFQKVSESGRSAKEGEK